MGKNVGSLEGFTVREGMTRLVLRRWTWREMLTTLLEGKGKMSIMTASSCVGYGGDAFRAFVDVCARWWRVVKESEVF